jgi:thioredoxin-dependent peroxiredoxin
MLSIDNEVPDFALKDSEGKTIKRSDFKGKKYVVYFYPKDFTPGCTTEAAEFARDYKKFKNAGIEIVGISPDDEESHKKFGQKMQVPFILLSDTDTDVAKKFGVWGKKQFMGREYMGVNRTTFLVDEKGKIFRIFEKVKPAGHAQEVLEAFKN